MQRPVQTHKYCVLLRMYYGGAVRRRRRASRRRRAPRRSWVERPYIGASVRWEHPYTDRLACLAQHMRSIQAGSPGRPKTRSRRRKPRRELCASCARAVRELCVARMPQQGQPVDVARAACSLQLAGRRSQLAVSCETPCSKRCSSRGRPVFDSGALTRRTRARVPGETVCLSPFQAYAHTLQCRRQDSIGDLAFPLRGSQSAALQRHVTVTRSRARKDLGQQAAANRTAARIRS